MKRKIRNIILIIFLLLIATAANSDLKSLCEKKIYNWSITVSIGWPPHLEAKCETGGSEKCEPCLVLFE